MSTPAQAKVAVIGGGIFGITAALALARRCRVEIFEKTPALLRGATFANHGRQHFGFHYPRSPETARQCLDSHADFQRLYGAAEVNDFPNYYAVASEGSKVDPQQYLRFCDKLGLTYEEAEAPEGAIAREKVAMVLRVNEAVLDYETLRAIALKQLAERPEIMVHLDHEILEGRMGSGEAKELTLRANGKTKKESFDYVVNATYAYYNRFCEWFGFEKKLLQYNLQELNVVELPDNLRIGVTVMDGVYPSVIPMGRTRYHLLAHVNESQLVRESSQSPAPLLGRVPAIESNWSGVLKASAEYLPMLEKATYIRSLFVDRVVDARAHETDTRLTDLTDHGSGCYSIFAAKVITCVSTAEKLAGMVAHQL